MPEKPKQKLEKFRDKYIAIITAYNLLVDSLRANPKLIWQADFVQDFVEAQKEAENAINQYVEFN